MTLRNERVRKELMRDISDILQKEISGLAGVVSVLDPELKFVYTDSLEKGSRVSEIIDKISRGEI